MAAPWRSAPWIGAGVCAAVLAACASTTGTTTVTLTPSPQAPVCDRTATALVLWAPQWRPDQKDVAQREAAAAAGLARFIDTSGCFARAQVRRLADTSAASVDAQAGTAAAEAFSQVVVIRVRELGPVVRLLSSVALVEGGTEVVLHVSTRSLRPAGVAGPAAREFTVHWQQGGPGVVKGVASLPADMQAALAAGLQPEAAAK